MKRTVMGAAALTGIGLALGACTSTAKQPAIQGTASATRSAAVTPSVTATPSATMTPTPSSPGQAATGHLELFTRLHAAAAYPQAAGSSEYDQEGTQRELDVTVTNIGGLAGHQITVFVNGTRAGAMLVSSTGRAHREWDTEHGQNVPSAATGTRVQVRTGNGTLVASGTYTPEHAWRSHPSELAAWM